MSRETKYTAIILKKQPFGEGDEIITFFTKEQGKVRALAKSVKQQKSKLQSKLQALFLVDITLTMGKLPKVIGAEAQKTFSNMRENLDCLKRAFYASELVLKFTPDEEKNTDLFVLLSDFLQALDSGPDEENLNSALARFKIGTLQSTGFAIGLPQSPAHPGQMFFSPVSGGFSQVRSGDCVEVSPEVYQSFLSLSGSVQAFPVPSAQKNQELQNLLSRLIEYHLERKVKSEIFLRQV